MARKVMISCAVTGSADTPGRNPAVPVTPEQIANVIVTHLHFDHAAGLTRLDEKSVAVPTFRNAPVHVQRRDNRYHAARLADAYLLLDELVGVFQVLDDMRREHEVRHPIAAIKTLRHVANEPMPPGETVGVLPLRLIGDVEPVAGCPWGNDAPQHVQHRSQAAANLHHALLVFALHRRQGQEGLDSVVAGFIRAPQEPLAVPVRG